MLYSSVLANFSKLKETVSPYKPRVLLKIHRNRLVWLGKLYVATIHARL